MSKIPDFLNPFRVSSADPSVSGKPHKQIMIAVTAKCSATLLRIVWIVSSQIDAKISGKTTQIIIPRVVPTGRVIGFSNARTAKSIKAALTPVARAVPSNRQRMLGFVGAKTAVIPVSAANASEM